MSRVPYPPRAHFMHEMKPFSCTKTPPRKEGRA